MSTIRFHSSPERYEFVGFNSSQSRNESSLIEVLKRAYEYVDISSVRALHRLIDKLRGIPTIRNAKDFTLSTP